MTVESAVYSLLSSDAGVSGVVSTRIYPVRLPQGPTYPCISYFRVSAQRPSVMGNDTGIVRKRIQVSSWGQTYGAANGLAEKVRDALQRKRGTFASIEILDIFVEGDGPEIWEEEANVYHLMTDYHFIYREAV